MINQILGGLGGAAASGLWQSCPNCQQQSAFQQQAGLAALQNAAAMRPVESPEERRNSKNHARWWALYSRDPLQDCIDLLTREDS